jgi:DNA polymerase-3 subunit epsilon
MESQRQQRQEQSDEGRQTNNVDGESAGAIKRVLRKSDGGEAKKFLAITERGSVDHLYKELKEGSYIVFDIETTGGNPSNNGITEIFALRYEKGEPKESFYAMVNPRIRIPGIVRRMTGITNQMVKDAPCIEQIMPGFVEFVGDRILVSHNTIGDIKFLRYFSHRTTGRMMDNYFLCTHLLAEKLIPESRDKSLKGLSQFFNHLAGHEVHRAEGDAYLTLELFKVILSRLEAQSISSIIDAIRFQGDYESAVRLGWGVTKDNLRDMPKGPGIYYLHDARGKIHVASSAVSISREVRKLSKFGALPRQLLKSVLASSKISFELASDPFAASLREAEVVTEHKLSCDPVDIHQRAATFVYMLKEGNEIRLTSGNVEAGAFAVFGPIKNGSEATQFMEQLAEVLGVHRNRKGLKVSPAKGEVLYRYLAQQRDSLLVKLWETLPFSALRREGVSYNDLLKRLKPVRRPASIRSLSELNGFMCVPLREGHAVYSITAGRAADFGQTTHNPEEWVTADPRALKQVSAWQQESFSERHVLTAQEAGTINRVAWWAMFGIAKIHGKFLAADELRTTLGLKTEGK